MEEQLRSHINAVFTSTGNMLSYLYMNTQQRAIPNPPGLYQAGVDSEVRKFQKLLDDLDAEIQLSKEQVKQMIKNKAEAEEKRKKQLEEQNSKNDSASGGLDQGSKDNAIKVDEDEDGGDDVDMLFKAEEGDNTALDSTNIKTEESRSEDTSATTAAADGTSKDNDNTNDNPMPDDVAFDDDLNALLDSVGGGGDQNGNQANEDIGLFGDDFDFVLPGQ